MQQLRRATVERVAIELDVDRRAGVVGGAPGLTGALCLAAQAAFRAPAQALPVTLVIEEEDALRKLLRQALAAARG